MPILTQADLNKMEKRYRAAFVNSLSGFKSVNLLGTQNAQGMTNLSIISSAFHLGADPALLGMIFRPHTVPRHTLENIQEGGYFTFNHVHQDMISQAHQTSARYEREQSEFDMCGLTVEYIESFSAPFVQESQIKLGLKAEEIHHLAINKTEMLIASLQLIILPEDVISSTGYIDIEKAKSIAVSGLDSYHVTERLCQLPYAKP